MPTYQYRCTECGRELEVVQRFSDPSLTECPNCSGQLRKIFNAVGVVFKGSGFYRTDSRDAGNKHAATDHAKTKTSSESSASSGSDDGSSSSGSSSSGSSSSDSSSSKDTGSGSNGSSNGSSEKKPAASGAGKAAASA